MKTPWQMAEVGSEYAHQTALFAWAAVCARHGPTIANDPRFYSGKNEIMPMEMLSPIPELQWLHAIKNSGHGDAIRGARAAAEGVRAGVPDIFLPVPTAFVGVVTGDPIKFAYHGLYVELKRPKMIIFGGGKRSGKTEAGRVAEIQTKWHDYLRQAGYAVEVCYGWEAARDAILKYLGR